MTIDRIERLAAIQAEKERRFKEKSIEHVLAVRKQLNKLRTWGNTKWYAYKKGEVKELLLELMNEIMDISDFLKIAIPLRPRRSEKALSKIKVEELVGTLEKIIELTYMNPYLVAGTDKEQIFNLAREAISFDTDSVHPLLEAVIKLRQRAPSEETDD